MSNKTIPEKMASGEMITADDISRFFKVIDNITIDGRTIGEIAEAQNGENAERKRQEGRA